MSRALTELSLRSDLVFSLGQQWDEREKTIPQLWRSLPDQNLPRRGGDQWAGTERKWTSWLSTRKRAKIHAVPQGEGTHERQGLHPKSPGEREGPLETRWGSHPDWDSVCPGGACSQTCPKGGWCWQSLMVLNICNSIGARRERVIK